MFEPVCRSCKTDNPKFPGIRTLRHWANSHFSHWLKNQDLGESGSDGCSASLLLEERGIPEGAKFLKSRWGEDCMYQFFRFKDNNGGSKGSHCLAMNFGICQSFMHALNLCFQRRQKTDEPCMGVTRSSWPSMQAI
jgi:hypothetical protein